MQDDVASTPLGLGRCLEALAEEASMLGLHKTMLAIRLAIETCRTENAGIDRREGKQGPAAQVH